MSGKEMFLIGMFQEGQRYHDPVSNYEGANE